MYAKIRDTRLPALGNVYSPASSTSSANWLTRALRPTRTVEEAERRRVRRGSGFGAGFMWTFKIASAPGHSNSSASLDARAPKTRQAALHNERGLATSDPYELRDLKMALAAALGCSRFRASSLDREPRSLIGCDTEAAEVVLGLRWHFGHALYISPPCGHRSASACDKSME